VNTDVQKFQQLANQGAAAETQNRTRAKQLLAQALELYRGDFCPHIDAEWCEDIRSYYRRSYLDVLKKLGRLSFEDKAYRESLDFYERALGIDEADESVHVAIMRCFGALNNSDGIQRQYKKLVKVLNRMGISVPSTEAKEIYQSSLR
jgi:two-component SAPR family response regulator